MLEGSPSVVLVGGAVIARGEVSVDAGLSVSIRLDDVLGVLPSPGDEVVVRIAEAARGQREYVGTVERANAEMLIVSDLELISTLQQRMVVRVGMAIPVRIEREMAGGELVDLETCIDGTILDLSGTGIRLHCGAVLREHYRFGFDLSTGFDVFKLVAEVLRCEVVPRGYRYGCRFVNTTQHEADALHRFVLSEQIAQRRRAEPD